MVEYLSNYLFEIHRSTVSKIRNVSDDIVGKEVAQGSLDKAPYWIELH